MIDPLSEQTRSLSRLARLLSDQRGESIAPSTIYRWARKGLVTRSGQRVRLETIQIGGTLCSTEDALRRFFAALSGGQTAPELALLSVPAVTEARLDAAGI